MKKRTIATKIMLPVFGVVLIFQSAVSLLGYYSYRQNNEKSYEEENADIVSSARLSFNSPLLLEYLDLTSSIYKKNTPTKSIEEMSKAELTAYFALFKEVEEHKESGDGTNYYS